jgi:hypothetical protein
MIERAGYPGIAADLDLDKIAAVLPALKKRAHELYAEGERLRDCRSSSPGISPPNSAPMLEASAGR